MFITNRVCGSPTEATFKLIDKVGAELAALIASSEQEFAGDIADLLEGAKDAYFSQSR